MSNSKYYIKLESVSRSGYFSNIIKTEITLVDELKDAVHFDTLASAKALIDYVLPNPLTGSWKIVAQQQVG